MPAACHPIQLVTTPREQYLRKEEARIRTLALPASREDEVIRVHLDAVLAAEDLVDIHESASERQALQGATRFAESHDRLASSAQQLKLYHLNQLANLLI